MGNELLDTSREGCPSPHSLSNKIGRVAWAIVNICLFRPSPRLLFKWRVLLLKGFGAEADWSCRIDPTARIWAPWNLSIGRDASIGHHADCYNVARITIGPQATISQYAFLCSASHDTSDSKMRLTFAPIRVESDAWVCGRAFVGPGTCIGQGAVVGACGVVLKDVAAWEIVAGNPARTIRKREIDPSLSEKS